MLTKVLNCTVHYFVTVREEPQASITQCTNQSPPLPGTVVVVHAQYRIPPSADVTQTLTIVICGSIKLRIDTKFSLSSRSSAFVRQFMFCLFARNANMPTCSTFTVTIELRYRSSGITPSTSSFVHSRSTRNPAATIKSAPDISRYGRSYTTRTIPALMMSCEHRTQGVNVV